MRFLHTVSTLNFGGVERLVTELALEQQRHGHQPAIYCCVHKTGQLLARMESSAVPVFGPTQRGGRQGGLAQCARQWRPDIVHSHMNFSVFSQVLACRRTGTRRADGRRPRFMVTQHSTIEDQPAILWRALLNYRLARPFIQSFTAVSGFAARRAGQFYGLKADKFTIIYNGVRPEAYQFDLEARARLRQTLALPPEALVWGTVGRLVPLKGQDNLIRAFAQARQTNPRLALVLVGAGPELGRLQALAAQLGVAPHVFWPGQGPAVRGWLSAMDWYVHASRYETLSLAILEALANGLPVTATRVGGVVEIAERAPAVQLVPGENVPALGEAIAQQSARAPLDPGVRSQSKLPADFLFESMYQAYAAIYEEL